MTLDYMLCSSSSCPFSFPVLSPNNGDGQNYLILLEIVLTPNLHLEGLMASLAFSQTALFHSRFYPGFL